MKSARKRRGRPRKNQGKPQIMPESRKRERNTPPTPETAIRRAVLAQAPDTTQADYLAAVGFLKGTLTYAEAKGIDRQILDERGEPRLATIDDLPARAQKLLTPSAHEALTTHPLGVCFARRLVSSLTMDYVVDIRRLQAGVRYSVLHDSLYNRRGSKISTFYRDAVVAQSFVDDMSLSAEARAEQQQAEYDECDKALVDGIGRAGRSFVRDVVLFDAWPIFLTVTGTLTGRDAQQQKYLSTGLLAVHEALDAVFHQRRTARR